MKNNSGLKIHGHMEIKLYKPDGTVIARRKDNIIVNAGFTFICDALGNAGARPAVLSHIAIGTDPTATDVSQTALLAEIFRKAATFSKPAVNQFQLDVLFSEGEGTGTLREAGVFNASSGGTLFDRVVYSPLIKAADDVITQRFIFTLS